ncbi:hypothetical protein [Yaniella halotolerans]|uniref:hypothetical protein n=1 Tax=Yaniella halotolerans TaxID=225453 RepID=UPI0003B5A61E|nr:hypothetical protein [Yaniella halotolerans]
MTSQPESTGIRVQGTELSEEETAALLAVVNTQLIDAPVEEPTVDYATSRRITSTWADAASWQPLSRGH